MNRLVMLPMTKRNQNFYISFQNVLPGNISDLEQLPLSSNAEIQHILNNSLSKLMLSQDVTDTGDVDLSVHTQDFVETFNQINHFCLNIESPQTQAGYNPFANE